MANPVVKARTLTLVAGNKTSPVRARGFTLLELLVVVSIIAIATAGVSIALRDSAQAQTERDAVRLAALLESARAQSRTSGVAVLWHPTAQGFAFEGLQTHNLPSTWLHPDTRAEPYAGRSIVLELGPEPLLRQQGVTLSNPQQRGSAWRVHTDGLHPFTVVAAQTLEQAPP